MNQMGPIGFLVCEASIIMISSLHVHVKPDFIHPSFFFSLQRRGQTDGSKLRNVNLIYTLMAHHGSICEALK